VLVDLIVGWESSREWYQCDEVGWGRATGADSGNGGWTTAGAIDGGEKGGKAGQTTHLEHNAENSSLLKASSRESFRSEGARRGWGSSGRESQQRIRAQEMARQSGRGELECGLGWLP
jgi:hypothetical protein